MTQVLRAVRLDYLTVKQYLSPRYLLLYVGMTTLISFVSFSGVGANGAFTIGMLMMYGLIFATYPFAIGEKTQMDLFYASLPMRRQDMVRGRYLYALSMQAASACVALVLSGFVSVASKTPFSLTDNALIMLGCFFVFSILGMLQLPIYFALGYAKAKILGMLPFLLIPLVAIPFVNMLENPSAKFDTWRRVLSDNLPLCALMVLAVYLVIFWFSSALSLRLYERREL